MTQFTELVRRNMRIYLRDKGAVFFSLLSMVIVIALMLFFLGDMNIEAITDMLGKLPGRDAAADQKNAELMVLLWTCAGIISINAVTVTLAALSSMIRDKTSGKINSIYTAPVSRLKISAAYICSACLSSVIVCGITLAITEIYCVIQGAEPFSLVSHLTLFGMIIVNSFAYSAIMYLVAVAAKTEGAWSSIGTIIGTLVGFLGGIYLPLGTLGNEIATGMKCLPVIYGTSMFRVIMTEDILAKTFEGAPQEMISEYSEAMGIKLNAFGFEVSPLGGVIILGVCGIICLLIGVALTSKARKTDR